MTLSRKGSRRITVDGVVYRWRLRGKPTYSQGMGWSPCIYAVDRPERGGTTLLITTDRLHPSIAWIKSEIRPVLPAEVANTIRIALARGWEPATNGPPFHLDLSDGLSHGPL
jgi:hypothetical protein